MKKNNQRVLSVSLLSAVAIVLSAVAVGRNVINAAGAVYTPSGTYTNHDGATYYNGINSSLTGTALRDALNSLNSSKRKKTMGYKNMGTSSSSSPYIYTDYDPSTAKKDSNGQYYSTTLLSYYSGASITSYNKEHVWPDSHGGNKVEADIHMPRPTIAAENSNRGNSFYVEGMVHSSNGWDPVAAFADNIGVADGIRGDCARIIFYCAIADTNLSLLDAAYHPTSRSNNDNMMGKLSDMLKWNLENPVTQREMNRNEGAEYLQGNRNPFIDHPEYACKIWGDTNNETRRICGSGGDVPPVPPVPPEPDGYVKHAGTETDPYSVANALEKVGADGDDHYVVGMVVNNAVAGTSGDYKFDLTDGENSIYVYYAKPNGLAIPTKGQYVTVKGKLIDYNGTKEVKDGTMIAIDSSYPTGWTLKESGSGGGGGNEGGDTPSKGKGCGGSIIATSALITVTSVAGLFLALNRRRKQD